MPAVSSVLVPYAAYLRVYEPLAAFAEPERSHWSRYARGDRTPTAQDELRRSLADLLPTPPVPVPVHESGDAFVTTVDGMVRICPWRTRLRGWLALEELSGPPRVPGDPDHLPAALLNAALPPVVRAQATADFDRWRTAHPDARPWIRTSRWQVPARWFVLFGDEERFYDKEGPDGPVLRYRTSMAQARRRAARALRALRESAGAGRLVEGLVDVGKWLEEFHPRALVELDYGGLVHVVPRARLAEDHSAADVAAGIAALRDGDGPGAEEAYARLVERWRPVRDLQFAN
ncbi:hypothetical protein ACFVIM_22745 [Streptomyces sp. NPDC057638]|uniref:hypothetical protein n=1 Tax=Streptomyces sp. NPDC057638 TaxID=3346190 RepID=UPI0036C33E4E